MRSAPLLTTPPPAAVTGLAELYAIALVQAETAASRYSGLANSLTASDGRALEPIQCVFEVLTQREQERSEAIRLRCAESLHKSPDRHDLRWPPGELVPPDELAEIEDSALATPYRAWGLAVRHRERAFVFWTYVAALANRSEVRQVSEEMAREALHDGGLLRRERRLAWRAERQAAGRAAGTSAEGLALGEMSSAALLESLLFKEVVRWGQALPSPQRDRLLAAAGYSAAQLHGAALEFPGAPDETVDGLRQAALRHAEQLTSIYLDEADRATEPAQLDLSQDLAAKSIARLANLRRFTGA